jgi:hypothetical protein
MIGIVNKDLAQNYPVQRIMVKEPQPEKIPEFVDGLPVGEIIRSLRNIQHGFVQIIIQDSRVIQIDRTEKKRITHRTETDYSI